MAELLLISEKGDYYWLRDVTKDFHCTHGYIKAEQLTKAKPGDILPTSKGVNCHLCEMTFADRFAKIKRGAQIITPKDAGLILATTLVDKESTCVDAGTGSGALSCFLARYTKHVYSYDMREAHVEMGKKNAADFKLDNITFATKNIYEEIPHENIDLITLDVPEPWQALDHAANSLKHGGWLVCYVPCVNQSLQVANAVAEKNDFLHVKTVELIERSWKVSGKSVRPETHSAIHTGFLSFFRRL